MKQKIYVVNCLDTMQVEGIYDIRNISDTRIASLAKNYEFINRGTGWVGINTESGQVTFINIPERPSPESLDLTKEKYCKILLVQESGNKLIEYLARMSI